MSSQQDVIAAGAGLMSLLLYDSAWTGCVQNPELSSQSTFGVFELGLGFKRELASAVEYANTVVMAAANGDFADLPASLRELLTSSDAGSTALRALEEHEWSVANLALGGLNIFHEGIAGEESQIEADARNVLAGEASAGYFGDRFLCGLAKASIAAGLITVWIPPHAHAAAAVGLGATAYTAGKCAGESSPTAKPQTRHYRF